ncbi:MAG: polyphosphate kinase 1 [Phycisphaerales bacterium]|nr:polyphosphate kinase 1 [Phycisphaerales bacterium]
MHADRATSTASTGSHEETSAPALRISAGASPASASSRPDVHEQSRMFNRDLSWLEFNSRVLQLAQDTRTPLLERVRFLGIFSNNLDEFVQKRIGLLHRRIVDGVKAPELDGLQPAELLRTMRAVIRDLQLQQAECFELSVKPALAKEGIVLTDYPELTAEEKRWLRLWFRRCAFPVLTPLAVDPGHRFPFISNLSRNFGVLLNEPGAKGNEGDGPAPALFARLKIPSVITQWVRLPEQHELGEVANLKTAPKGRFVPVSAIIAANLDDLFPGMNIQEVVPFRVYRDSENPGEQGDEDADNLLELVQAQLKQRRFAHPVRLETGPSPSPQIVGHLLEELGLKPADTDERVGLLDYTTLFELADLDRPELKFRRWTAVTPARLRDRDQSIFDVIRQGDVLVHHPFESFEASATRFIQEAAKDPDVLAIKQTIYRTSKDSPFVQSLIRAAESGKQVAVLVELRARFDEQANVRIASALEKAGAHVAYGVLGYKTHCKAAMVVRREDGGVRTYAHLGTGNYHPRTAQLYTDLGLFTCDPSIVDDLTELFNFLTGRSRLDTYETLLVAPINMKRRFIAMIQREIGFAKAFAKGEHPVGGRIVAKMNAFADSDLSEHLYAAAQAGVQITLFVRGFCCLRPGVPGLSENIRIVSVLGRFLEHSRIFHFGCGKADPLDGDWFISSADWMYRNLNNRVEAGTPVIGRSARAKLLRILQVMAMDRRGAWELRPDGRYDKLVSAAGVDSDSPELLGTFETLMREARS